MSCICCLISAYAETWCIFYFSDHSVKLESMYCSGMFEVWKSVTEQARMTRFCATAVWWCLDTPALCVETLKANILVPLFTAFLVQMMQEGHDGLTYRLIDAFSSWKVTWWLAEKLPLQHRQSIAKRGHSGLLLYWYVSSSEDDSGGPTHARTSSAHTFKPASAVITLLPTVLARCSHSPFHRSSHFEHCWAVHGL